MTVPLPSVMINQKIEFPVEDGAVFEQPYMGAAGSGTYRWISPYRNVGAILKREEGKQAGFDASFGGAEHRLPAVSAENLLHRIYHILHIIISKLGREGQGDGAV